MGRVSQIGRHAAQSIGANPLELRRPLLRDRGSMMVAFCHFCQSKLEELRWCAGSPHRLHQRVEAAPRGPRGAPHKTLKATHPTVCRFR